MAVMLHPFTIYIGDPSVSSIFFIMRRLSPRRYRRKIFYNLRLLRDDHGLPIRAFKGVQVGVLYRYPPLLHGSSRFPSREHWH